MKDNLKEFEKELQEKSISLEKFLIVYCGVIDDNLYELKLDHKDIKKMMPQLKRIGKQSLICTKRLMYTGSVIPVRDHHGNIALYISPKQNTLPVTHIEKENIRIEIGIKEVIYDEDLEPYQISELCNKYKQAKRFKEYRIAKRILKSRLSAKNRKVKQYKREKEKIRLEDNKYEY